MRKDFNKVFVRLTAIALLLLLTGCGSGPGESEPGPSVSEPGSSQTEQSSSVPQSESETAQPSGESSAPDGADELTTAEKISLGIMRNQDTVGWITIPGSTVDDAVLQYKDNDYYLRLNEDKKYDIFGCYFMDYESTPQSTRDKISRNNIIYGHSDLRDNKDGPKFSQLFKYTDVEFVRDNPYIYYATRDEEMVWQVFAVFYTRVDFEYHLGRPDDAAFLNIISEAKLRSEYIIDVPVSANDKILTLSTCTVKYKPGDSDNYRLVVMAKLLSRDAKLSDNMDADINPDPKRS